MMSKGEKLFAIALTTCLASVLLTLLGVNQKSEALYHVRLITHHKNFSASPRPRVPASVLTISIQPDTILSLPLATTPITTLAQADSETPSVPAQPLTASPPAKSPLPDDARLIDIRTVNPNIRLDIRYATTNNFLNRKLYPKARCVLRGAAARRLAQVQKELETKGLGLKVYDCYRPLSVQKLMWQVKPDNRYVANPKYGSRHNRGAAVDLTLVDRNGKELEMPTGFDDFTTRAHRDYKGGSAQARKNSQVLEDAMKKYGFIPLSTEWWHFDAPGWDKYAILDVGFGEIP